MRKSFTEKLREQPPERKPVFAPGMFYRRYYEDFLEYSEIDAKGESVIRRVYQGTWFTADLDRRGRILFKTTVCAAWLAAAVLFGVLIYFGTPLDSKWYMAAAHALTLTAGLWNYLAVVSCLLAPEKMTVYWYKTSVRDYRNSSRIMAAGFFGSALIVLASLLFPGASGDWPRLPFAAGYLAAGAIMFLMARYSGNITFTRDQAKPFRVSDHQGEDPEGEHPDS